MNCNEAQRLIMPFINKKLNNNQLEEFITHVNSCSDCMDELEVYYVLLFGMKQLDEDKVLSNNFHQDLMNLLKQSEERILREKIVHIRKRIFLMVVIVLAAFISSFRIGEIVVEDVLEKEVEESNFIPENLFLRSSLEYDFTHPYHLNKQDPLPGLIVENLDDIYVYLDEVDQEGAKKMREHFEDQLSQDIINSKE